MGFRLKKIISIVLNMFGITSILLRLERKKYGDQYIRIINYHDTTEAGANSFRRQIIWLKKHYHNVNYEEFNNFLSGQELQGRMPGIILSFDDGLLGNYEYAMPILDELQMTGYFMVSADLVGTDGYMNLEQLKEMVSHGHVVGCHTSTHHRMDITDTKETLNYEIIQAKHKLESILNVPVTIFCWCGGEEQTYTRNAQKMIEKAGYQYGFMTNSQPVTSKTDRFHIQRINVEDTWSIALLKFQICGIMDYRFRNKRNRVNVLTKTSLGK